MNRKILWKNLVLFFLMSSYLYIFMEWLFLVTKPSYMSNMSIIGKLEIFFAASGVLIVVGIILMTTLAFIDTVFLRLNTRETFVLLAVTIPSSILTSLFFLMFDNFTYTVFKFGVVTTDGWWRGLYVVGIVSTFFFNFRWGSRFIHHLAYKMGRFDLLSILGAGTVLLVAVSVVGQYDPKATQALSTAELTRKPNILIIGSDGVNANNMSLYNYERDTTPYLKENSPIFLVAENAFTNSGASASSVTSILTGKLPFKTQVYGEASILMGSDSFQHLPGILNEQGYRSIEIGVPHYVDAYNLNFQGGFDEVNHRSNHVGPLFQVGTKYGFGNVMYFLEYTVERVTRRILHVFFIQTMENPYKVVTQLGNEIKLDDEEKVDYLLNLLTNTHDPLFVHMHLMGTHGTLFFPKHRMFSANQEQTHEWMTDFYDDAIYDFDSYVKEIFDTLSSSGKLDNTIVVIYTDHNMLHETNQRIPLLFHFPKNEFSGMIQNDVQNVDIAPTVLDYLGVPKPEWMDGQSLLPGEPSVDRLIHSSNINEFAVTVIECNQWYRFERRGVWFTGPVYRHTSPCGRADAASLDELPASILEYINKNKFTLEDHPENTAAYLSFSGNPSRSQVAVVLLRAKYGPNFVPSPPIGIFEDVSVTDPNAAWIEHAYLDGIVDQCSVSPLRYCPDDFVARWQAAEYILKAKNGRDYIPLPASGVFEDVPLSAPYASWVEELYRRKITSGCSVVHLNYCPDVYITGGQLTVFLNSAFNQPGE